MQFKLIMATLKDVVADPVLSSSRDRMSASPLDHRLRKMMSSRKLTPRNPRRPNTADPLRPYAQKRPHPASRLLYVGRATVALSCDIMERRSETTHARSSRRAKCPACAFFVEIFAGRFGAAAVGDDDCCIIYTLSLPSGQGGTSRLKYMDIGRLAPRFQ